MFSDVIDIFIGKIFGNFFKGNVVIILSDIINIIFINIYLIFKVFIKKYFGYMRRY